MLEQHYGKKVSEILDFVLSHPSQQKFPNSAAVLDYTNASLSADLYFRIGSGLGLRIDDNGSDSFDEVTENTLNQLIDENVSPQGLLLAKLVHIYEINSQKIESDPREDDNSPQILDVFINKFFIQNDPKSLEIYCRQLLSTGVFSEESLKKIMSNATVRIETMRKSKDGLLLFKHERDEPRGQFDNLLKSALNVSDETQFSNEISAVSNAILKKYASDWNKEIYKEGAHTGKIKFIIDITNSAVGKGDAGLLKKISEWVGENILQQEKVGINHQLDVLQSKTTDEILRAMLKNYRSQNGVYYGEFKDDYEDKGFSDKYLQKKDISNSVLYARATSILFMMRDVFGVEMPNSNHDPLSFNVNWKRAILAATKNSPTKNQSGITYKTMYEEKFRTASLIMTTAITDLANLAEIGGMNLIDSKNMAEIRTAVRILDNGDIGRVEEKSRFIVDMSGFVDALNPYDIDIQSVIDISNKNRRLSDEIVFNKHRFVSEEGDVFHFSKGDSQLESYGLESITFKKSSDGEVDVRLLGLNGEIQDLKIDSAGQLSSLKGLSINIRVKLEEFILQRLHWVTNRPIIEIDESSEIMSNRAFNGRRAHFRRLGYGRDFTTDANLRLMRDSGGMLDIPTIRLNYAHRGLINLNLTLAAQFAYSAGFNNEQPQLDDPELLQIYAKGRNDATSNSGRDPLYSYNSVTFISATDARGETYHRYTPDQNP